MADLKTASAPIETGVAKDPTSSIYMGLNDGKDPKSVTTDDGGNVSTPEDPDDENGPDDGSTPDAGDAGDDSGDTDGLGEDLGDYSDDTLDAYEQRYRSENGELKLDVLTREWDANAAKAGEGGLNEGTYKFLEDQGFTRDTVKAIEAGQVALRNQGLAKVHEAAGGKAAYDAAFAWGKANYTPAQKKSFNAALASGNVEAAIEAVELLQTRINKANGGPRSRRFANPKRSATDKVTPTTRTGGGFESRQAWLDARTAAKGNRSEEAKVTAKLRQTNRRNWTAQ